MLDLLGLRILLGPMNHDFKKAAERMKDCPNFSKMANDEAAKRKGRPKGVEKVVFKRRINKELEEAVDKWFDDFIAHPGKYMKPYDWKKEYGGLAPANPKPSEARGGSSTPDPQVKALLDDVESLTARVLELEELLVCARSEGLDEKAAFWKAKYLDLENKVRQRGDS